LAVKPKMRLKDIVLKLWNNHFCIITIFVMTSVVFTTFIAAINSSSADSSLLIMKICKKHSVICYTEAVTVQNVC